MTPQLLSIHDLGTPGGVGGFAELRKLGVMYDEYLGKVATQEDSIRVPGIHASEISHCIRQAAYTLLSTEKRTSLAQRDPLFWFKKFQVGKHLHTMLQDQMHAMGRDSGYALDFDDEVKIDPYTSPFASQYNIHSSCDGVFTLRKVVDGRLVDISRCGLEIKTASYLEYPKIIRPKADHMLQAHLYMACLDLPACWLLYWNKGNENYTGTMGPFLVPFDWTVHNLLESRIEACHDAVDRGDLPEREEGQHCRFCTYSWICSPASLNKTTARRGRRT